MSIHIKQKTPLKLISEGNHTNKRKSSLTSLVACFILVECVLELTEDDMPLVQKKTSL